MMHTVGWLTLLLFLAACGGGGVENAPGDAGDPGVSDPGDPGGGGEIKAGDEDSDGMADEWELTFALDPNDSADAAQDPDVDGFTNLEEYQAGTDPTDGTDGRPPIESVLRGPYLQQGTPETLLVKWRTDYPTTAGVYFGLTPQALELESLVDTPATEHTVMLTSLQPDTTYYYRIGNYYRPLVGADGPHSVLTPPVSGSSKPTRIWVIGDSGTANQNAAAVRDAFKTYSGPRYADLWLMLGDNAYSDGEDREYQEAVFDMYPELLRRVVLWPTLGNHDGRTADSDLQRGPYYDIFALPTNGEAGGVASGTEAYYSFDYANIHFVCLESYETDRSPGGAMLTWLENDLAATDKPWLIAFWHHPPYSKGSHDSDSESRLVDMRENALPILEAYGVDLVLSGHSHSYERSFFINGHYGQSDTLQASMILDGGDGRESSDGPYQKPMGAGVPNAGAVYAVAGSSGKTSGGSLDHPVMIVSLNTLGSIVLDIAGNRLEAVFIDDAGSVQDQFSMVKSP